jgi:predicted patatin/cPLA2 family phospholipase
MTCCFKNIGGDALEFVMNKIMSIDKDAESYRKGIEELLKEKQNELEKTIVDMRENFQEESKNIKSAIGNEKIIEAENRAKTIIKEKEEGLTEISSKYEINKLQIVEDVYNGIIKSL